MVGSDRYGIAIGGGGRSVGGAYVAMHQMPRSRGRGLRGVLELRYLQRRRSFMHYAEFDVVICARCGLTQLFAEPDARVKLRSSSDWKKL